jgi:head-tail adaptor
VVVDGHRQKGGLGELLGDPLEPGRRTHCREDEQPLGIGIVGEHPFEDRRQSTARCEHRIGDDDGVGGPDIGEFHVVDTDREATVRTAGGLVSPGADDTLLRTGEGLQQPLDEGSGCPENIHDDHVLEARNTLALHGRQRCLDGDRIGPHHAIDNLVATDPPEFHQSLSELDLLGRHVPEAGECVLCESVGHDVGLAAFLDGHPNRGRGLSGDKSGRLVPAGDKGMVLPRVPGGVEETLSGFKERGTWTDVVEFGERVAHALRAAGAEEDSVEEFDEWRPKAHDRIDEEVSEKTADQASVGKGAGEAAGEGAEDDLQTAGEELSESYRKLEEAETDEAVERWRSSLGYVARAADTAGRKALRAVEESVYRTVMTQVAPYYFDNEIVSANLSRVRSQEEFVLEVNVTDDELKTGVADELVDFEEIQRWHVDTERETSSVEAAEGVEAPETEDDASPTTN